MESMSQVARLTPEEVESALTTLPEWSVAEGKLRREYRFADFTHAFGFMAAAATVIEKMDHHPEWLNVYGRVTVELWTHSAGGLTARDVRLAQTLEAIATKLLP
jgi:4a-hydroxytetrahydrobiopterin dehydratase